MAGATGLPAHRVPDPRGGLPGVRRDAPGVAVSRARVAREDRLRPHDPRGPRARSLHMFYGVAYHLSVSDDAATRYAAFRTRGQAHSAAPLDPGAPEGRAL